MQETLDFLRLCFPYFSKSPITYSMVLTRRCNTRCTICNICESKSKDLPLDVIKRFVNESIELNRKAIFSLTGGEPTLRKDILEIIDYIKLKGGRVILTTNGEISPGLVEGILARDVKLFLTFFSMDPKIHDLIRGKDGNLGRTVSLARRAGRKSLINCVIFKDNVKEISGVIEYCSREGYPLSLCLIEKFWDGGTSARSFYPGKSEMDLLFLSLNRYRKDGKLKFFYGSLIKNLKRVYYGRSINCQAYRRQVKLNNDGMLYVCNHLPPYGNFAEGFRLRDIPKHFNRMQVHAAMCKGCTQGCFRTFGFRDLVDRFIYS